MIKFQANNALIHSISPVIAIPSKTGGQDFQKRELVIDDSWDKDGRRYPNYVLIEFSGDRMGSLDAYMPGHHVNVEGMICGREHNGRIFNTVRGLSIAPSQPMRGFTPTPAYPQQTPYPQQPYGAPGGPGSNFNAPPR